MTDEQINAAIAEACGWTDIDGLSAKGLMGKPPKKLCSFNYLPNYCNDLNAMHEAEETVFKNSILWVDFMEHLCTATGAVNTSMVDAMVIIIRATARQRAEAFLRTLGKWEDGK